MINIKVHSNEVISNNIPGTGDILLQNKYFFLLILWMSLSIKTSSLMMLWSSAGSWELLSSSLISIWRDSGRAVRGQVHVLKFCSRCVFVSCDVSCVATGGHQMKLTVAFIKTTDFLGLNIVGHIWVNANPQLEKIKSFLDALRRKCYIFYL